MRGGVRKNSGGARPGAGRPADPRLTAAEAAALLEHLCPGASTPTERAQRLSTRPERIREALHDGCTVKRAATWRAAAAAALVVDQKVCPHDGVGCGREECREDRCHAQESAAPAHDVPDAPAAPVE